MKNRFFVINKEKIYAYIVSIMTIVVIFFMSNLINSDFKETELTSSNSITNAINEQNNEIGEAISTSVPSNAENENEIGQNKDVEKSTDEKISNSISE